MHILTPVYLINITTLIIYLQLYDSNKKHVIFTEFLTVKPHLNERTRTESKNYQIKQALTKCEGYFDFFFWWKSLSLGAHQPTLWREEN